MVKNIKILDSKTYKVFISHATSDVNAEVIKNKIKNRYGDITYFAENAEDGIHLDCSDFPNNIIENIKNSRCGVVLLSQSSIKSPWVMLEVGALEASGKSIILYDSYGDFEERNLPFFLRKNLPIIKETDELLERIKQTSIFGKLFEHETRRVQSSFFYDEMIKNSEIAEITINIESLKSNIEKLRFGCIILNLAKYGEAVIAGTMDGKTVKDKENEASERCFAKGIYRVRSENCLKNDGSTCNLLTNDKYYEDFDHTIILNKVIFNTEFNAPTNGLKIRVPLHKKTGVSFKMFVDVFDISIKDRVRECLEKMGAIDVSISDSAEGQRIYFLIPRNPGIGIYNVYGPDEDIYNNYICPGII